MLKCHWVNKYRQSHKKGGAQKLFFQRRKVDNSLRLSNYQNLTFYQYHFLEIGLITKVKADLKKSPEKKNKHERNLVFFMDHIQYFVHVHCFH